ncbi:hypothetical protein [Candidatus Ornithobacterium hominis]|uniref:hypothetical protein n=1 Tax=Candidatus Ornithobacterium hominis TaxID=2497989 RepID=UPI0024BC915D|nr:hypothetical protein [Candidatus Ornithobacterium hominis]
MHVATVIPEALEMIRPTTKGKIYEDYFAKEKKRLKSRHNHFLKTIAQFIGQKVKLL